MSTQVILLERVENLGAMGEVVNVKPGYARNFLLPRKKALRATKENIAYFETQRKVLEATNQKRKDEAQGLADKVNGLKVTIIRQASEGGQLFGSVTTRDIAEAVSAQAKVQINRGQVQLNNALKMIGLFPVSISLHAEVKVSVTLNIARSEEEAKIQEKTGKAMIVDPNAREAKPEKAAAAPAPEAVTPEGEAEDAKPKKTRKSKKAEAEATEDAA